MISLDPTAWYPIAAGTDLPLRHTFHGQLLGREMAVWRADDGYVNVWENRCLHRGVRLSIGINDGVELRCQYHGWRYASRTGGCTYIPAHPADAPARTICNHVYPVAERYGLVWSALQASLGPPAHPLLDAGTPLPLRGIEVRAAPHLVRSRLGDLDLGGGHLDESAAQFTGGDGQAVVLEAQHGDGEIAVVFFLQPLDADRTVVRGVLAQAPDPGNRLAVLHRHDLALTRWRELVEAEAATLPAPEPIAVELAEVPVELAALPEPRVGRTAALRLEVSRRWAVAEDIVAFELAPLHGHLPAVQPGAHLDLHLPNGLVRQYSLVNGPGEQDTYRIAVKREASSRGGSACLHDTIRVGDVLAVSEPRNNFPLRRDALRTVLIAGGIGITPLLPMAQVLARSDLEVQLHAFVRAEPHVAFRDILDELDDRVTLHLGLGPEETIETVVAILGEYHFAHHVYICGPAPMLDAVRRVAAGTGWPDEAVHFEYFANLTEIDDSTGFDIALSRSALDLHVPAGTTLLEVLRAHGIDLPSSCEQGACGTCEVAVIEGEPLHQDVYLNESERHRGDRIMTCVSRARTGRLVLDV